MPSHRLRVAVIADGPQSQRPVRAEHWTAMLAADHDVQTYHLADWIGQPQGGRFFSEVLGDQDVIIVNWDAINGDPDFASDRALLWVQYRTAQLLDWVAEGGLLIVEGQALFAVPHQQGYDALLGRDEVRVCGPEDRHSIKRQAVRIGCKGRVTNSLEFAKGLDRLDASGVSRSYQEMFPGNATKIVPPWLAHQKWNALYRGWFRWNPLKRNAFVWTVVARTGDRKHNHPIMLVAPHGAKGGGIFVTTMLLASSNQKSLVHGILECAGEVSSYFPSIHRWRRSATLAMTYGIPLVAALLSGAALKTTGAWGGFASETLKVGLVVLVALVGLLLPRIRRYIRDVRGL